MRTAEAPQDIVMVAIDEPSIRRLGPYPWPRSVAARAIDTIAAAHPKAIALDVLYAGPTDPADDTALARSVAGAGNVVAAAQMDDSRTWILPIPEIAQTAAALGHVNVDKDARGEDRDLTVHLSDTAGRSIRPLALETVLAGGGAAARNSVNAVTIAIDYLPARFNALSIADVVEGRRPPSDFAGKYVLIGATAPSLGNRIVTGPRREPMTGVEVLANAVNTILRSRFYSETRDINQVLCAAVIAVFVLIMFQLIGRRIILQIAVLLVGVAAIWGAGAFSISRLVYPPMTAELVSFVLAAALALAWKPRGSANHV